MGYFLFEVQEKKKKKDADLKSLLPHLNIGSIKEQNHKSLQMWWGQGKCCPNLQLHGEPGGCWPPEPTRAGKGFQWPFHCAVCFAHLVFHQEVNAAKSALKIGNRIPF